MKFTCSAFCRAQNIPYVHHCVSQHPTPHLAHSILENSPRHTVLTYKESKYNRCKKLWITFGSRLCPFSQWCHPTVSSSVVLFSSHLQSFPALGSFQMSDFFASGGQSIGALVSVPPMNIQDWFPWGLTSLIYLQSKGLSRVFSNTIVQKHQFFGTQPSLWSNSHIHTSLLEKP